MALPHLRRDIAWVLLLGLVFGAQIGSWALLGERGLWRRIPQVIQSDQSNGSLAKGAWLVLEPDGYSMPNGDDLDGAKREAAAFGVELVVAGQAGPVSPKVCEGPAWVPACKGCTRFRYWAKWNTPAYAELIADYTPCGGYCTVTRHRYLWLFGYWVHIDSAMTAQC